MDTQDVFYNPSAPPGFMTSASTWLALHTYQYIALIYMHVNVQHGILYNTDMHHTDDYMVVWECMYIYMHFAFKELIVTGMYSVLSTHGGNRK